MENIAQQLEGMRKNIQKALEDLPVEQREQILKETEILTKLSQGITEINNKANEYQNNSK